MSRKLEFAVVCVMQKIGTFAMEQHWPNVDINLAKLIDEWNNELLKYAVSIETSDIKLTGDLTEYNSKMSEIIGKYNKWVNETGGIEIIAVQKLKSYLKYVVTLVHSPVGSQVPTYEEDLAMFADLPFAFKSLPLNTYYVVDCLIGSLVAKAQVPKLSSYFPLTAVASTTSIRRAPVRASITVASIRRAPVGTSITVASLSCAKRSRVEPL